MTAETDEFDSQEFYEICQAYRHEPLGAEECVKRFEAIKQFGRLLAERERAEPPFDPDKNMEHFGKLAQKGNQNVRGIWMAMYDAWRRAAPPPAPELAAQGMVPREPTEEMTMAGLTRIHSSGNVWNDADGIWMDMYDAALSAAPAPSQDSVDARRYRYVRSNPAMLLHLSNKEFDATIDAAISIDAAVAESRGAAYL